MSRTLLLDAPDGGRVLSEGAATRTPRPPPTGTWRKGGIKDPDIFPLFRERGKLLMDPFQLLIPKS